VAARIARAILAGGSSKKENEMPEVALASAPTPPLEPGDEVFAIITPSTEYMYSEWRNPFPYFLLKGSVEVRHSAGHISLNSGYAPFKRDRLFLDESTAREKLAEIFEKETLGTLDPAKVRIFDAVGERAYLESRLRRVRTNRISL
jgi:hypothetical protein